MYNHRGFFESGNVEATRLRELQVKPILWTALQHSEFPLPTGESEKPNFLLLLLGVYRLQHSLEPERERESGTK